MMVIKYIFIKIIWLIKVNYFGCFLSKILSHYSAVKPWDAVPNPGIFMKQEINKISKNITNQFLIMKKLVKNCQIKIESFNYGNYDKFTEQVGISMAVNEKIRGGENGFFFGRFC